MSTVIEYQRKLEQLKGARSVLERNVSELQSEIKDMQRDLRRHEQAREIVRNVGMKTQQQLQFHISDIVSLALDSVFDDPYELKVEFIQRRNKTECDLTFQRDGEQMDPLSASGGGAVDVASFALRIASWAMMNPRSRNVIVLDEPLRFLSEDHQEQASRIIKELSDRLKLQFLIITHEPLLGEYADRVFQVSIKKGISQVKQS